uniref:Uncharacterized protein n=1 Tax=Romanomermis culicivorax TaxID=13658 RepID=A0A915IF53_ROMCU
MTPPIDLNFIRLICTCLFRRNGTEFNRRKVIERKGNFRSVRLEFIKLLTTRSVTSERQLIRDL